MVGFVRIEMKVVDGEEVELKIIEGGEDSCMSFAEKALEFGASTITLVLEEFDHAGDSRAIGGGVGEFGQGVEVYIQVADLAGGAADRFDCFKEGFGLWGHRGKVREERKDFKLSLDASGSGTEIVDGLALRGVEAGFDGSAKGAALVA